MIEFDILPNPTNLDIDIEEQDIGAPIEMEEVYRYKEQGTDDYEKLKNLPLLNGEKIIGDVNEIDPTVPDWAKASSKPSYTADEVGAVGDENALSLSEIDEIFNGLF